LDKGPDSKFFRTALKHNALKILQIVWEGSFKPLEGRTTKTFLRTSMLRSTILKNSRLTERKKNFTLDNALQYHKNKRKSKNFSISELLMNFKRKNNHQAIAEIMKWKYLEYDRDLMNVLFKEELYDEVYNLIWNRKNIAIRFNKDQFREVIKNGEQLDLILYFLRIQDCRVILDEPEVQKSIVNNYMKTGNKLYYGAEMLVAVYRSTWQQGLTKYKNLI
jgi:hypothetical protein